MKRSQAMNTKMLVVNSGSKDSAVKDKTVRQALGHLVNRNKIATDILDKQEKPATQLFAKMSLTLTLICLHVNLIRIKHNNY